MAVHKPRRLEQGARVGVIAPAGCVDRALVDAGIKVIRSRGYLVETGANLYTANGYLAGSAEARARDLVDFFRRSDIDAIFCARGGFGSAQLLPYLTEDLRRHPKIFVGYSDITFLLNWFRQSCNLVTFHAPMVAMDLARGLTETTERYLWPVLSGATTHWKVALGEIIRPGKAEAEMMGGCLSLLVTTLGTPYEIDPRGKLLFLEDIGEKPYRVERMLTHLKMAGKLDGLAGVLFGDFTDCDGAGSRGLREIARDLFGEATYPVVMGMKAGHGTENLALPFGVKMRLDGDHAELALLEAPVT